MFQRDVQSLETIKVFYHFVDGLLAIPNEVETELAHRIALENGLDTVVGGDAPVQPGLRGAASSRMGVCLATPVVSVVWTIFSFSFDASGVDFHS